MSLPRQLSLYFDPEFVGSTVRSTAVWATLFLLSTSVAVSAAQDEKDNKIIADGRIATAIEGELWGAKGVNANPIDVTVNRGIVTLSGRVNNVLSKDAAARIAKVTKGVRAVVDQIEVKPEERSDTEISRDVLNAISHDPATDSWDFDYNYKTTRTKPDREIKDEIESEL